MKTIEGKLDASGLRFAIIISRFNEFITNKLLSGAIDCLNRNNAADENITLTWVPGAFEIPSVARKLAASKKYDAVICLGAVIRGATPHFDLISAEVTKGVAQVALASDTPVIFGVITTDSIEQAIERAGTKSGNKGFDAAMNAIEMANIYRQL